MEKKPTIQPFDFHRIFIGSQSPIYLFEIVFRTAIMYVSTLILVRIIGKRALNELSVFEYIMVFTLGSAVGDPMFYPEIPLTYGVIVMATIVSLQRFSFRLSQKSHPTTTHILGKPATIVINGQLQTQEIEKQHLTKSQVYMLLREQGIEYLSQIRVAYLEPSGKISVFRTKNKLSKNSILPQK